MTLYINFPYFSPIVRACDACSWFPHMHPSNGWPSSEVPCVQESGGRGTRWVMRESVLAIQIKNVWLVPSVGTVTGRFPEWCLSWITAHTIHTYILPKPNCVCISLILLMLASSYRFAFLYHWVFGHCNCRYCLSHLQWRLSSAGAELLLPHVWTLCIAHPSPHVSGAAACMGLYVVSCAFPDAYGV